MDFKPIIESVFKEANESPESVFNVLYEDLIEEICKRVWNKAIEVAADNAEADYTVIESGDSELSDVEYYVLKGSILKHKL